MPVNDPVFQDKDQWYFWDETWTSFLGPFLSEEYARERPKEYGKYLSTGEVTGSLVNVLWEDGEELGK